MATGIAIVALGVNQPPAQSAVSHLPLWLKVAVVLTAAIAEELVWRSYPIERLTELTGLVWVGAVVSAVVATSSWGPSSSRTAW